jgi:cobalt-precorrin-5B (C1)-methyltransferase
MPGTIVDPVSGMEIPEAWLKKASDPEALMKIKSGRWVLLSDGRLLRRGYTTGTTAAATCKGAILSLVEPVKEVEVPTPSGLRIIIPARAEKGTCTATKDGGDHEFDVTSGLDIVATAKASEVTELVPGEGIGRIVGCSLPAPASKAEGKAAISRSALDQIKKAIEEGLEASSLRGARVELVVPSGREIAQKTLNPKMGVIGGISILGSTGFVEPWNEHLGESRQEEIKSLRKVVVTTGRIGLRYSRVLFPEHTTVLLGSRLERLSFDEDQESILCGLPALILKWAWPEVLEGSGYGTVAEMVEEDPHHPNISRALEKAKEELPGTRIVLLHRDGRIFRDIE